MKKKTPHVRTLPPTAESSPSLAQLLAAALAENERMAKLLDELREENAALKRKNAALTQENITLRDRLNQNSANSNQPPSQDVPAHGVAAWVSAGGAYCFAISSIHPRAGARPLCAAQSASRITSKNDRFCKRHV